MKGDIEKLEKENEFLCELAKEQKKQLIKIVDLNIKREKLKKQLEQNRKCLLLWQTKKRFGIKECNSERQAWEYIKMYNVIYWSIIDGYIFSGNWEIDKVFERR